MTLQRRFVHSIAAFAIVFASISTSAIAQPKRTVVLSNDGPTHVITVNPFFLLAGWVSAEYEQRVNSSIGLGGGVSYVDFSDTRYTNFEVKGRLYPNEHAMRGLGIAVSFGVTRLSFNSRTIADCVYPTSEPPFCDNSAKNATSPAVGIEFGYQWLLGTNRRTAIAVGLGGKRFLASKSSLAGTEIVIPTYRLGVGYAF